MYPKRGRETPSSNSGFQHDIDYAGLPRDVEDEEVEAVQDGAEPVFEELTNLKLSRALNTKLATMAREEGVSLEQLAQELLAEGATLRAWEIIERKSAMRGAGQPNAGRGFGPGGHSGQGGYGGHSQQRHGANQGNRHGGQHGQNRNQGGSGRPARSNNAWMEDKAAFLEYVRNQEKRRR